MSDRAVGDLRVEGLPEERTIVLPDHLERTVHERAGSTLARYRRFALYQGLTDAAIIVFSLVVAYFIRFGVGAIPADYTVLIAASPLLWVAVFASFQLYAPQRLSTLEELRATLSATSIGVLLMSVISFWSYQSFSRIVVGLTWALALALELGSRGLWRRIANARRAEGTLALRTVIVGANEEAVGLVESLKRSELGFEPIGFVADKGVATESGDLPVLGHPSELEHIVMDQGIDCIFVADSAVDDREMMGAIRAARRAGIELRISSRIPELVSTRLSMHPMGGAMAMAVRVPRLTGFQLIIKRTFDIVTSGLGLVVLSPVFLGVAIATKLSSPGPVFFTQERVTRGGQVFKMLKFRTMRTDGDALLGEMDVDKSQAFFKLGPDDPRITNIGRFLRRFSLDELPQLVNVLIGDMTLVGPRPLPHDQVAKHIDLLTPRHDVAAGMTGWWQVKGRSEISSPVEAVELDQFYIENWSLGLDLYILLKTVRAVVAREGAH